MIWKYRNTDSMSFELKLKILSMENNCLFYGSVHERPNNIQWNPIIFSMKYAIFFNSKDIMPASRMLISCDLEHLSPNTKMKLHKITMDKWKQILSDGFNFPKIDKSLQKKIYITLFSEAFHQEYSETCKLWRNKEWTLTQ